MKGPIHVYVITDVSDGDRRRCLELHLRDWRQSISPENVRELIAALEAGLAEIEPPPVAR